MRPACGKLAFSTLGCPDWNLEQVVAAAVRFGYRAIELRCLERDLDLLRRPELRPSEYARTRRLFERSGLAVCAVDTSCSFHGVESSTRRANVELALRYADLAAELGAQIVRVFPNEVPEGASRADTQVRITESLHEAAERFPDGVSIGLETHGDFATGRDAADLVRAADHPALAIVWDAANTTASGEHVAEACRSVAPYLRHVHLRDARPVPGERWWRPALAGEGRVPLDRTLEALAGIGYAGWISFEWEKFWYDDLEGPEVALPDFVRAVSRCAIALL